MFSPIFSIDGFSDLLLADYEDRLDEEGHRGRPLSHPVHRDTVEKRCLRLLVELGGPRMGPREALELDCHQPGEAVAIDGGGETCRHPHEDASAA